MVVLSSIFSVFALVFSVISIVCVDKKSLLLFQVLANIFYSFSYLFKGSILAFLGVIVATIRTLTFYLYAIKNNRTPFITMLSFIVANVLVSIISYKAFVDILPIVGMSIFTYFTYKDNLTHIKFASIVLSICLFLYNLKIGLYISCIQEIILLLSAIFSLCKQNKIKKYN